MKRERIIVWLFLWLLSFPWKAAAQEDSARVNSVTMNGYVEDMQAFIFHDFNSAWINSNLVRNRLNFKWHISSSLTASMEMTNRFLVGNILTRLPLYKSTFDYDNGMLSLSRNWFKGKNYILNTSVDRLWLQYSGDKLQVTAGRQRINWGQNYVWNPNDIFNAYSYLDFDYVEKPGSDAVRLQYFINPTSVFELAAKLNRQKRTTLAVLYRFNKWKYDIQLIAGMVDRTDWMLGAGWSGQIKGGGITGEASYFRPMKHFNDTTGVFLASLGYNYTFRNSLAIQAEVLYNGNKSSSALFSVDPLSSTNFSAKNLFLRDFSFFASLSYPVTPLINCSLAGIGNAKNKQYFIIPTVTVSLSNNLELSAVGQLLRYTEHDILRQDINFAYFRLKQSF